MYTSLWGMLFLLFVASSAAVSVVSFACSSHYPRHVALLHLPPARLSSPLIGFRYIKPLGQGAILPIKHPIFSAPLKAGGVQPALRMVIGYLLKLPQVGLCWFFFFSFLFLVQGGGTVPFHSHAVKLLQENVCSLLLGKGCTACAQTHLRVNTWLWGRLCRISVVDTPSLHTPNYWHLQSLCVCNLVFFFEPIINGNSS